jgi:hypothetical protein
VVRRLAPLALLAAGCGGGSGSIYEVRVTPTAEARAQAARLDLTLRRTDDGDRADYTLPLPSPTPAPPWTVTVDTRSWGPAPIAADAAAILPSGGVIARGSGSPVGSVIDVLLEQVVGSDGGVFDLRMPDLRPDLVVLPDLATLPDLSCGAITVRAAASADTILVSGSVQNFGTGPVMNVGTGINSVGLLRFDVSALPVGKAAVALRLTLHAAHASSSCAANCGSCDAIEKAGNLAAFFLRSDWVEGTTNWNVPWASPGAGQGAVDYDVTPIALVAHVAGADTTFATGGAVLADLPTWRSGNLLSFKLQPSNGAVAVAATREWAAENCKNLMITAAALEIDYCP